MSLDLTHRSLNLQSEFTHSSQVDVPMRLGFFFLAIDKDQFLLSGFRHEADKKGASRLIDSPTL